MSRRQHYADLYDGPARDGRPLGVVHGNCQAEALRVLLAGSPTFPWQLVRVPPAHELAAEDLPALDRLLGDCTLLLAQPVRDGYRGLPLGTSEVAARLAPGAQVVRWPVVYDAGVLPWQAIVRAADGAEPPVVPYHDLRTLTGRAPVGADLVAAAAASRAELAAPGAVLRRRGVRRAARRSCTRSTTRPTTLLLLLARRVQAAARRAGRRRRPGPRAAGGHPRAAARRRCCPRSGWTRRTRGSTGWWTARRCPPPSWPRRSRPGTPRRPDVVAEGLRRYADRLPLLGLA